MTQHAETPPNPWPMTNDPAFDAGVDHPAYPPGEGPSILLDGAHHNFFVDEGFMVPFQRLMRADGYRITVGRSAWSSEYLSEFDIVVVITALPFDYGEKNEVTDEVTFSGDEIRALHDWVTGGGSALIFSEHAPMDQAIRPLMDAFGIEASVGTTIDPRNTHSSGRMGWIVYSEANGLLNSQHPIVRGRGHGERVGQLVTFRGSALDGAAFENIFRLSAHAANVADPSGVGPLGSGDSQGLAGHFGAGKLVAFGDANGFTAMEIQLDGEPRFRAGMNLEGYDWKQLVLNVMHWLSDDSQR